MTTALSEPYRREFSNRMGQGIRESCSCDGLFTTTVETALLPTTQLFGWNIMIGCAGKSAADHSLELRLVYRLRRTEANWFSGSRMKPIILPPGYQLILPTFYDETAGEHLKVTTKWNTSIPISRHLSRIGECEQRSVHTRLKAVRKKMCSHSVVI